MEFIKLIGSWLNEALGLSHELQVKIVATVFLILIVRLVRITFLYFAYRRESDLRVRFRMKKNSQYASYLFVVPVISYVWSEEFQSLSTFLGLLTAGIAIALKDPVMNFAGWIFILWRKPFEVGDRIQVGEHAGDVIDIKMFQFTLIEIGNWVNAEQSTGRILHVPNGKVFSKVQANYMKGFTHIWDEIPIRVTFESNWRKAKDILNRIVNENSEMLSRAESDSLRKDSQKNMIFYNKLTPIVYTNADENGVLLTIRFLTEPRKRRSIEQKIWESILDEFNKEEDIQFAYSSRHLYHMSTENKKP